MTNPTAAVATTPVLAGALAKATSWSDVFRAQQVAVQQAKEIKEAPLPQALAVTPEESQALSAFEKQAKDLVLPQSRRALNEAELRGAVEFMQTVKTVKAAVERAEKKTLKPALFGHFDAKAKADGLAKTSLRNSDGYLIAADDHSGAVAGLPMKAVREVRSGSVSLPADELASLEAQGVITHEEFLSLTTQVRVTDDAKVVAACKKDPTLVERLSKATKSTSATVSLNLRKNG